jgi:glycosyltransferase involved in cell wall biosynthesis
MALQKIREQLYIRANVKVGVEDLKQRIPIGKEAIAVCPSTTGNSWQGVLTATEGLFGDRVFQIPQYYSNCIYTEKELQAIGQLLAIAESEHIVFSGYLPYFDFLIETIVKSGKKVSIIYHGSHTSVLEDPNAAKHFNSMVSMLKLGILYHVGFVKKDMEKTFGMLTGQTMFPILLKTDESLIGKQYDKYEGLNIGVMTHDAFRKNLYNMVSAALLHPSAKVHVKDRYLTSYMGNADRIITHGHFKDQNDFFRVIGSVDLNMYVTFSECWGQFVNESLALGVPCLCSDVSAVLDYNKELKDMLVVREFDNDYAIYLKSKEVLQNIDYFKTRGPEYVKELNLLAKDRLKAFLS